MVGITPHHLTGCVVPLYVQLNGSPEALTKVPGHTQRIAVTEAHLRTEQVLVEVTRVELDLLEVVEDLVLQIQKQID